MSARKRTGSIDRWAAQHAAVLQDQGGFSRKPKTEHARASCNPVANLICDKIGPISTDDHPMAIICSPMVAGRRQRPISASGAGDQVRCSGLFVPAWPLQGRARPLLTLGVNSPKEACCKECGVGTDCCATALLTISSAHEDLQKCFGRNFAAVRCGSD